MAEKVQADVELNLRDRACPYPLMDAEKALKELEEDDTVLIRIARKGKSKRNIVDLSKRPENELLDIDRREDEYRILLRRVQT